MKRRRRTGAQRIKILHDHDSRCYLTGHPIDPVRDKWEIEHVIPLANGGTDDDDNCRPVLASAHLEKTKQDLAKIAKGKRIEAKHFGTQPKPKRPLPCGRRSQWKKKITGEIVPR